MVSRNPGETFRTLATYREFQSAVLGRTPRAARIGRLQSSGRQFKEIEEAERQREQDEAGGAARSRRRRYWFGILWPNQPQWSARWPAGPIQPASDIGAMNWAVRPEDAEP